MVLDEKVEWDEHGGQDGCFPEAVAQHFGDGATIVNRWCGSDRLTLCFRAGGHDHQNEATLAAVKPFLR